MSFKLHPSEYQLTAIRSSGPGGQHANKVATGILLSFDVNTSSLNEEVKERLLNSKDSRITKEGIIIIKATSFRSQEKNKKDAVQRLEQLVLKASIKPKKRKKTRPTSASKEKRREEKKKLSEKKSMRKKPRIN